MRFLLLMILGTIYSHSAWAQDVPASECVGIESDKQRLACFDRIYARPEVADAIKNERKSVIDLNESLAVSAEKRDAQLILKDTHQENPTVLSRLYDLDKNRESGLLTIREHQPMYLMPAWYNASPNYTPVSPTREMATSDVQQNQKRIEAKMQVSFKTKLMQDLFTTQADLWFGHTQQSNWQVYNQGDHSAPFRNSDYAPELFLTQPVQARLPFNGRLRMLGVGYIHQSNGQSRPLSRSWNRAYLMSGMEWGDKLTIIPRVWLRMDTDKGEDDDNPNIMHYMGYGDVKVNYQFNEKHNLTSTLRFNPRHKKGAVQVDYTFPIKGKLKGYVQGFYGYGENLSDYNHKQKGVGLGVTFQGWSGM